MERFIKQFFYLILALPLGIFYFVAIVTGLSLGTGLFITWLGIPILIATFGFCTVFSKYERTLANNFLDANIAPLTQMEIPHGMWANFKTRFLDERTWMRIFYLVAKFPLGVFTFSIEIALAASSLFLIATPFLYQQYWYRYVAIGFWHVTSLSESLLACGSGIVLAVVFYYVTKGFGVISKEFARSALTEK